MTARDDFDDYDRIPGFWDACDAVEQWLERHPDKMVNPSTIARGAKVDRDLIYQALAYLERHHYIAAVGNGCWRNYGARR